MITTTKKKIIILIPYPAQGHVTPILKLASLLSNLGFRPLVMMPEFIHRRISPQIDSRDGIICLPIADGLGRETKPDFFAIERAMEENMPAALEQLVNKMILEEGRDGGGGIACVVADVLASWAFDVARRCGVTTAGFWTAMHSTYRLIAAIPHLISRGVISENGLPINPNAPMRLASYEPILTANDLPWLIGSQTARISRFKFWTRTLDRAKGLNCLLTNTFPNECLSESYPSDVFSDNHDDSQQVFEIGPLVMQAATISSPSLWREDTGCLDWLDTQREGSVLYVSFGSWVSPIKEAKVRTLALTLEKLKRPFIWVLGHAWRQGLPVGYAKRVAAHGRIVPWAPQVEVLQHPAVCCYLTHCGWNSTVESIQCKVPLLCYPIAGDQFLNSAYIANVWKTGVKIDGFDAKEVEDGIKKVVEDEEMNQRIERLNDKFFGKGGSSKAMANLIIYPHLFKILTNELKLLYTVCVTCLIIKEVT